MAANSLCPSSEQLRQLLAASLPQADQDALTAHLDNCEACRLLLDHLAGANPALLAAAFNLRKTTFTQEPPLRRVLDVLASDAFPTMPFRPTITDTSWVRSLLRPAPFPELLGLLGEFEITDVLGQGGMGLVLKAFDRPLNRWVAIKVLGPNLGGEALARQRFAREAQAAAAVRHANVVTIHAVDEINGLPFFVMEYVAGGSLQDYLDHHGPPDWPAIAHLGAEIASGLAAAHAQGLIHRDIKPSNILLQTEGANSSLGSAKIGDFGLARAADDARLTQSGIVPGTPMYMAPEQAMNHPLDHRADLFSLGSVLYTLCTGHEPFPGDSPMAVLRLVCEAAPRPIHDLNPTLPGWLAGLVERLQAKLPADRFSSSAEVAEMLLYNLDHPDAPRQVSPPRLGKKPRRAKRALLAAACLAALLLAGTVIWKGGAPWSGKGHSHETMGSPVPLRATLEGHSGPIWSIAYAPDGLILATGSDDGTLRFWDSASGKETARLPDHGQAVFVVAFAHSGKFLVSGDRDGTLRLWDVAGRKENGALPHQGGNVRRLSLSFDDKTLAVGSSAQGVELWDLENREIRRTLSGSLGTIRPIAFTPDDKVLAAGDASGRIQFWDPSSGTTGVHFRGDSLGIWALAFTPDGQTLATAGTGDKDVKLWKTATQEKIASLAGFENGVQSLALSPDGRLLAVSYRDGVVKIWDLTTLQSVASWSAHQGNVLGIAFSPDSRTLATAGEDRLGKLWDLSALEGPSS